MRGIKNTIYFFSSAKKLLHIIALVFTVISLSSRLNAQVTFDATSTSNSGTSNVTSLTWSHTTGAGSNRLLVVTAVIDRSSGTNISGITYNGTALTQASLISNATEATQSAIYYLVNPPTGSYNIVISCGLAEGIIGCGVSLANVCQATPVGTAATNNVASTANSSLDVTSSPGDYIIDVISLDDVAPTLGTGQTQRANAGNSTVLVYGATSTQAAETYGSTTNMNWTFTSDSYTHIGIAVKSASPVGGTASAAPVVAVDAVSTSSSGTSNATSLTWSHTVSGPNTLLVVTCAADDGSSSNVTSVTYNGVALTNLSRADNTNSTTTAEMWYLVNPPSGTYNIVWTHGGSEGLVGCGVSFNNVHQSTPFGAVSTNISSGAGTSTSVSVASGAGDYLIDVVSAGTYAPTADAGQTVRQNAGNSTVAVFGGTSTKPSPSGPSSTTDMGWTFTSQNFAQIGVAVKPIASGICSGSTAVLSLTGSTGAIQWQQNTGTWTNLTGGTTNPFTTGALTGTNQFRAVSTACATTANSTTVTVTVDAAPTTANAGSDQTVCTSSAGLAGNTPTAGSGTWTLVSGTGTITTPTSPGSGVTGLGTGANTFRWTIMNGACGLSSNYDDVIITYQPTTVNAGADQTVCATTATMAADAIVTGTGVWTLIGGSGTITTPTSPTSGLTALGSGANTFRWTLTSSCGTLTDDVIITNNSPTTSSAGSDQRVCATTATLAGNTPSIGTGAWSLISGSGTITTSTSPTSGLTALGLGDNTFRWTITYGTCTSTDDVIITRGSAVATAAASPTTTPTVPCAGSNVTLTGTFGISGGSSGPLVTLLSPTGDGGFETGSTFAANGWTAVNEATSYWYVGTASNGYGGSTYSAYRTPNGGSSMGYCNCTQVSHFYRDLVVPASASNITLSFYWASWGFSSGVRQMLVYTAPTTVTPVAGTPAPGSTTIAGATLVWTETNAGSWTLATISLPQSLAGTTVRLIFTTQNGGTSSGTCGGCDGDLDNISFTYNDPPPSANPTYSWTSTPAGFTSGLLSPIANPTVNTTYTFVGTDATTGCSASATVAVTVGAGAVPGAVTVTKTGSCTSYTLTATGGAGGTIYFQGTTSGGVSTADNGTTQVITVPGTYYFRAESGGCWGTEGSSVVTIDPDDPPAPTAAANPSCGGSTYLNTMVPPGGITYYWQGTSCGTSTAQSTASTYAVTTTGTYYVRAYNSGTGCWSANCENVSVAVSNTVAATPPNPTAASNPACASTYLNIMTPPAGETYYWQGTNSAGTSTTYNTLSTYPITSTGTYYVRSMNTAGCWSAGSGSIAVTVNALPATPGVPTVTAANPACATATLTATPPANPNIGYWQGTSCGTNTGSDIAVVPYPVSASGVYYLRVRNATTQCWSACSSVSVTIIPSSVADAGPDQSLCNSTTTTTLAAVPPMSGSGTWSVFAGTATITTPTSATSGVTGLLAAGSATLRWTVTNAPCANITDDVIITTSAAASGTANAGPDQYLCAGTLCTTMAATGAGNWTQISGASVSIQNAGSATTIIGVSTVPTCGAATGTTALASGKYVFRWTSTGCGLPVDDVVIWVQ